MGSTSSQAAGTTVTYPAPSGFSSFHSAAEQLAADHPKDLATGRWMAAFRGTHFEFTWIEETND